MPHFPDFDTFAKLAATADYVPVYRRVLSDVLTPVSAFHTIDDGGPACLFASVICSEKVATYSFLAAEPFIVLEAHGNDVRTYAEKSVASYLGSSALTPNDYNNPLDLLRHYVQGIRVAKLPELPPF